MARKSVRMESEVLKDYKEVCANCKNLKNALAKDKMTAAELCEFRFRCANCQEIFKFDALLRIAKNNNFGGKRNKGKKSKITVREKNAIKKLKSEGKTIKELARIFNYNKNTILKILHEDEERK